MNAVVMVVSIESIPVGVLISLVFQGHPEVGHVRPVRRPRFWVRFAAVLIVMLLPDLVGLVLPLSEQAIWPIVLLGFAWGLLLLVPSGFVLFHRSGADPEPGEEDDEGPGPGDGRPSPSGPTGGVPLPDAEPSSTRIRGHRRQLRPPRPRRPVRERERRRTRLWRLAIWPRVAGHNP